MKLRAGAIVAALVLGFSVAALAGSSDASSPPAVAGLESDTWSPASVTIAPGGTVTFADASKSDPHGVVWDERPETPSCSGVPIDEGRTNWSGTCTFTAPGTYHYHCFIHGTSMSGVVNVEAAGTTTTTSTTPTVSTPTTTTPAGEMPGGSMNMSMPPAEGGGGQSGTQSGPAPVVDSLHGLSLKARQRRLVHGAVEIALPGSALDVAAFAPAAQIGGRHGKPVLVGSLTRRSLAAGRLAFNVSIDSKARAALRAHGVLTLTLRIVLLPPSGKAIRRTLTVHLAR